LKALRVLLSVLSRMINRLCDGNRDDVSAVFKKAERGDPVEEDF